jgi:hypothetical protein
MVREAHPKPLTHLCPEDRSRDLPIVRPDIQRPPIEHGKASGRRIQLVLTNGAGFDDVGRIGRCELARECSDRLRDRVLRFRRFAATEEHDDCYD